MITTPIRPGTAARQGIHRPRPDVLTITIAPDLTAWGQGVALAMRHVTASLVDFSAAWRAAVHRDHARRAARIEAAP